MHYNYFKYVLKGFRTCCGFCTLGPQETILVNNESSRIVPGGPRVQPWELRVINLLRIRCLDCVTVDVACMEMETDSTFRIAFKSRRKRFWVIMIVMMAKTSWVENEFCKMSNAWWLKFDGFICLKTFSKSSLDSFKGSLGSVVLQVLQVLQILWVPWVLCFKVSLVPWPPGSSGSHGSHGSFCFKVPCFPGFPRCPRCP